MSRFSGIMIRVWGLSIDYNEKGKRRMSDRCSYLLTYNNFVACSLFRAFGSLDLNVEKLRFRTFIYTRSFLFPTTSSFKFAGICKTKSLIRHIPSTPLSSQGQMKCPDSSLHAVTHASHTRPTSPLADITLTLPSTPETGDAFALAYQSLRSYNS